MTQYIEGKFNTGERSFAIIVSRFNDFICERLLAGAMDALVRSGTAEEAITVVKVPGCFEIPLIAKQIAGMKQHDAIICLGTVIRGATSHFDFVSAEVSKGIAQVGLEYQVPVIFGVLTTDTIEQAIERAGAKAGNKGWDAAMSAIEMADLMTKLKQS